MKLRHAAASPFVRKVMVVAHEQKLVGRIELIATSVSPVQANDSLAGENPLMKVPSLVTDERADRRFLINATISFRFLGMEFAASPFSCPRRRRSGTDRPPPGIGEQR